MSILLYLLLVITVFILTVIIVVNIAPQFGAASKGKALERIENSPYSKGGKFKNLQPVKMMEGFKWSIFKEYFNREGKFPKWEIPIQPIPTDFFSKTPNDARITWFGHSALLLEIDGKKIFLDPMLGKVPSPFSFLGTKRFNENLPMKVENIPYLDAVIMSHDHYDHLDYGSILALKDRVGHFFVPLGVAAHLIAWGVSENNITALDWWESTDFDGLQLTCTPSQHFSGRGMTNRFSTLWSSWVIKGSKRNIYFGADSGYSPTFKEIGEKYGPFDFAMLECGQYNDAWSGIHMRPEETVQAGIDVQANLVMPIHWGAFQLALHTWTDPIERFQKAAATHNITYTTPKIGESVILGQTPPNSKWWIQK